MRYKIVAVAALLLAALPAPAALDEKIEGRLTVLWLDASPHGQAPAVDHEFWLHKGNRSQVRLEVPAGLRARLQRLDRRPVRVTGRPEAPGLGRAPVFRVRSIDAAGGSGPQAAAAGGSDPGPAAADALPQDNFVYDAPITGPRPWINVRCKFADRDEEFRDDSYFTALLAATRPGLDYYWKEQSNGQMRITGSATTRWFRLPKPYSDYVNTTNGTTQPDLQQLAADCLDVADPEVDFSAYYGLNLVFNESFGCCAWGGGWYMERDGASKVFGITWLPPWGWTNHTLVAHEMGHGFGLSHSQGNYQTYRNPWDVMSDIWHRCYLAQDEVLGCLGLHTIGYHKRRLGWVPDNAVHDAAPGTQSFGLDKLERPTDGLKHLVRIPILGSDTHYYTVETRRQYSFDRRLIASGVVIHEIDLARGESANVVDRDNDTYPYDEGTYLRPGDDAFEDATGIRVRVDDTDGGAGYLVTVTRPNDLIFRDGFESGDISAWNGKIDDGDVHASTSAAMVGSYGLAVVIDDNNQAHLTDHSPEGEPTYQARFLFSLGQTAMAPGDRFVMFGLYNDTAQVAALEVRRNDSVAEVRALARANDGSAQATDWVAFDNNGHVFNVRWRTAGSPGATDGLLELQIDQGPVRALTGLGNGNLRVERALIGAVTGVDSGTRGTLFLDDFNSTRW